MYRAKLLQRLAEGDQKVGLLPHHRETGRHHANHRLRPVVCGEGHAEHVSTGEALLPEFVAQHDDRAVAAEVFLGVYARPSAGWTPSARKTSAETANPSILSWPLTMMARPDGPTMPR